MLSGEITGFFCFLGWLGCSGLPVSVLLCFLVSRRSLPVLLGANPFRHYRQHEVLQLSGRCWPRRLHLCSGESEDQYVNLSATTETNDSELAQFSTGRRVNLRWRLF